MNNEYRYEWTVVVEGNLQTIAADRAIVTEAGALLFLEDNGPRGGMIVLVGFSPRVWTSFEITG